MQNKVYAMINVKKRKEDVDKFWSVKHSLQLI